MLRLLDYRAASLLQLYLLWLIELIWLSVSTAWARDVAGCHVFNAAVAVIVVVPVDQLAYSLTRPLFGSKWLAGVFKPTVSAPSDSVNTVLSVIPRRYGVVAHAGP